MTNLASPNCELSIVMPCLNESETLTTCIDKASGFLRRHGITGEIVIADNGSDDGSREIAKANGARVVDVPIRGYGAALLHGIGAARGRYVIMGDSDDSYDFSDLSVFLSRLRDGFDFVIGNRFEGGIAPGAMPWLHKYLGNPVLSRIGRLFFGSPVGDFHCGLRGFNRQSIINLELSTTGMEFASEMVVKATLNKLRITEVPTTLSKDGRNRPPHLRSWHDGWRHLRFLLMYSPRWLFFYPGLALIALGLMAMMLLLPGPATIGTMTLDVHTLMIAAAALILGSQTVSFAWLAKQFGANERLFPPSPTYLRLHKAFTLEKFIAVGTVLIVLGLGGVGVAIVTWGSVGFGDLDYGVMMRIVIPAVSILAVGFQVLLTGFLSSILDLSAQKGGKLSALSS